MAELSGLPVPKIDWHTSDLPQEFKKFKALCQLMFDGPLSEKEEKIKVKYLLIWSGQEGIELVSTWDLSDADKNSLKAHWTKFEQFVLPKSNFRLARHRLRRCVQSQEETIDSFMKRVRILISECKYTNSTEQMIDTFIEGVRSESAKVKLMKKDENLTVDDAIEIVRIEEALKFQVAEMNRDSDVTVNAMKYKNIPQVKHTTKDRSKSCTKCGRMHPPAPRTLCPAYGTTCDRCGKNNHWRPVCWVPEDELASPSRGPPPPRGKQRHRGHVGTRQKDIHAVQLEDPDMENLYFESLEIHASETRTAPENQPLVSLLAESKRVRRRLVCKTDTGADGNLLPIDTYRLMFPNAASDDYGIPKNLEQSSTKIYAYGDHEIVQYGKCNLKLHHESEKYTVKFHVSNSTGPIILGMPTCRQMQLVTLNYSISTAPDESSAQENQVSTDMAGDDDEKKCLLKQYPDCFDGVGCFAGDYHITLDNTVPPVIHPPRRVPVALREPLHMELNKLESQGIVAKVDQPTDWVNSFVCTTKPRGGIRLRLDPKDLNRAIKRPHHVTPNFEDVLPKLTGAKYFSILDARSGYWNIKLDEESSYYTTFNTPYGRYRFLRLPFGLICAQDVFQRKVDETFGDLPGVTGIADDIVIIGVKEDGTDHDENLKAVLERARQTGIKFNPDKMVVKCKRIPFFGNIIGAEGLEADPSKVAAIQNMGEPNDLKQLQAFLGLSNYLSKFTPHLSSISAPLRDLCKQNTEFQWGPEHGKAFKFIQEAVQSTRFEVL